MRQPPSTARFRATRLRVALAFCGSLCACGPAADAPRATVVFAAASLTAPFTALGVEFERRNPGSKVDLHFAGTPSLLVQLAEGAPADVFAAADEPNMQRAAAAGLLVGQAQRFASNRLAIVVAAHNPLRVMGLADLARADLRIALCGPEVPAGRYARQALAAAGVQVQSRSDEPSVRALVAKVRLGEVDAGIVYTTDVPSAAQGVSAVAIPAEGNVLAHYPIAVAAPGANRDGGARFVAFVLSAAGQDILRDHGFGAP